MGDDRSALRTGDSSSSGGSSGLLACMCGCLSRPLLSRPPLLLLAAWLLWSYRLSQDSRNSGRGRGGDFGVRCVFPWTPVFSAIQMTALVCAIGDV